MSRAPDRKEELLADRATQGLPEAEARELERLGGAGDESLDYAAAAAALAELGKLEEMPAALKEKVLAAAPGAARPSTSFTLSVAASAAKSKGSGRAEGDSVSAGERVTGEVRGTSSMRGPKRDRGRALGWIAATAAAVLAIFGWMRPPTVIENVRVVEAPPPRPPAPVEARARLLAQAQDVKTIAWSATKDPAATGATGDVVWSPSKQQGYLRIRGLQANDPKAQQYQLWIFDATRDQRYPVDGGVFDVRDGEVVIAIHAPIEVRDPKLFAVTVEKPGGVVVSGRERIVLTAAL
ncbi:MAG: anti-sigma factor [Anaeromyxobacteraceae bacterium]